VEANGFVIGVKPVSCTGSTGPFRNIERFPSSFDSIIAFPMDQELAFLSHIRTLRMFSTSHSSCPEAAMVTGSLEPGSGRPGKALRSGLW